jgi:membrane associated rhomboid family serine protease
MDLGTTPASIAILGCIVVVSFLALQVNPGILERNLLRPYWVLRKKTYDTIVTCGFIHGDFGHLLFNGLTLFFFGPSLESRIGTVKFVLLYFIGLIVSSLGTVWKRRNDPNYASLGASGAILAVLFASIMYFPDRTLYLFFALPIPAPLFAVGYLAYSIWASKNSRDNINHDAHLDGALTGILFVMVTDFQVYSRALRAILSLFGL